MVAALSFILLNIFSIRLVLSIYYFSKKCKRDSLNIPFKWSQIPKKVPKTK